MLFEMRIEDIHVTKCDSFDFPYHLHNNVEILICTSGSFNIICNDQDRILNRGDILIAFPGDVHAYHKTDYGEGIMIIFNPNISELISDLFMNSEYENFVTKKSVIPLAEDLLHNSTNSSSFTVLYGYLHVITGMILKKSQTEKKKRCINTYNSIIEYIAFNFTDKISLKSISQYTGISQSHISRIFSTKIKGGFKNYLNLLRIEKAKILLKTTDKSIYEIMYESGFSDQCTFNRVFKRMMNCTPKEYRKQEKSDGMENISTHNHNV